MRVVHSDNLFIEIAVVTVIELRVGLTCMRHVLNASVNVFRLLDFLIIKETSEITDIDWVSFTTGFTFFAVYTDTGKTLVSVSQYFFQILHLALLLIVWINVNLHTLDERYADFGLVDILQCIADIDLEIIIHIIDIGVV